MFEGPVTGNIPEVLDNGEVTDGTHVTAGQLALALTPYAQVTDLAVNTAASLTTGLSNNADQSAFDVLEGVAATKSTPDGVDLKLSNYSTTAAMNGSIASANNATLSAGCPPRWGAAARPRSRPGALRGMRGSFTSSKPSMALLRLYSLPFSRSCTATVRP